MKSKVQIIDINQHGILEYFVCFAQNQIQVFDFINSPKLQSQYLNYKMQENQQNIEDILRRQSLLRITSYTHPQITLKHEPINAKQCQQLKIQLRDLVKQKVEIARQEQYTLDNNKYEAVYGEFVQMTVNNQAQEKIICTNIREMHQIADVLMNPPNFNKDLYLSSKEPPKPIQKVELENIYKYYEKLYKSGFKKQQNEAEEAIKKAKKFILEE